MVEQPMYLSLQNTEIEMLFQLAKMRDGTVKTMKDISLLTQVFLELVLTIQAPMDGFSLI